MSIAGIVEKFTRHTTDMTTRKGVTSPNIYHFPLREAYFCPDCECVTNSPTVCPSCTNESGMMPLSKARW
jgi:hypothetical protein